MIGLSLKYNLFATSYLPTTFADVSITLGVRVKWELAHISEAGGVLHQFDRTSITDMVSLCYDLIWLERLAIGIITLAAIRPTIPPMKTIMTGSMMELSPSMATSTSSS